MRTHRKGAAQTPLDQKAADAGVGDNPKTVTPRSTPPNRRFARTSPPAPANRRETCEGSLADCISTVKRPRGGSISSRRAIPLLGLLTAIGRGSRTKSDPSGLALSVPRQGTRRCPQAPAMVPAEAPAPPSCGGVSGIAVLHFAVVAALALVEWVSLSTFYAEGSDFGLLGGVLIAMALSVVNISLAVLSGNLLRYVNHQSVRRRWLALSSAAFLYACFALVTLAAAHYRVATNDIAQVQPTVSAPSARVMPPAVSAERTVESGQGRVAPLREESRRFEACSRGPGPVAAIFGILRRTRLPARRPVSGLRRAGPRVEAPTGDVEAPRPSTAD